MRLLERDSFLAALGEYAGDAGQGDGRLVLVSGESGIGKTALIAAFHATLPTARWLWGGADDLLTPRPLGPLFDIAPQAGGELAILCTAGAQRDSTHRDKLFTALATEINQADVLTVVVIEDVHWADEATIDLLGFLGRRLSRMRALVLVTFRDDELAEDHRLRIVLGDLATQRATRRMSLPPLSASAVGALIGERGLDAAELHRVTGGNPFYVTEVVDAGWPAVPPTVREAVGARLARSGQPVRAALEAAAVIGVRCDRAVLAQLVDDPDNAVRDCLESRLLVIDGPSLRFRHELVRMAVLAGIAPHRKIGLHARLLAILSGDDCADQAVLAHHAEEAGDAGAVLRHAVLAADSSSALGAHREAAGQFERALRFAAGADTATLASLHEGVAREYALLDRWQAAEAALTAAITARRELGDDLRLGADLRLLSVAYWRLCQGEQSWSVAQESVLVFQAQPPSVEAAWAYANVGVIDLTKGLVEEGLATLGKAREMADQLGQPDLLSYVHNSIGLGLVVRGRDGLPDVEQALAIALDHELQELAGRAYSSLVEGAVSLQRFDDADHYYQAGIGYCEEHELGVFSLCLNGWRSYGWQLTGRWDEAAVACRRTLAVRSVSPVNRLNPLRVLGAIQARRGEPDGWRLLDEAAELSDGNGEPQWIAPVRAVRAELRWLTGEADLAERELRTAYDLANGYVDPWVLGSLAILLFRLGLAADPPRCDLPEPYALEAAGDGETAAAVWDSLGRPYDAALVRLGLSDEASLRQALAVFDQLGVPDGAAAARRRMRQLGFQAIPRGARAATKAAPSGLTVREQEVLALVAEGLADREIANRLFISERTVHHHVSAILSKIGVTSRTAAAREAARLGMSKDG